MVFNVRTYANNIHRSLTGDVYNATNSHYTDIGHARYIRGIIRIKINKRERASTVRAAANV